MGKLVEHTAPQVVDVRVDIDLVLPLELGPHAPELFTQSCQQAQHDPSDRSQLTCASLQYPGVM